jgi:hypothetical protein
VENSIAPARSFCHHAPDVQTSIPIDGESVTNLFTRSYAHPSEVISPRSGRSAACDTDVSQALSNGENTDPARASTVRHWRISDPSRDHESMPPALPAAVL